MKSFFCFSHEEPEHQAHAPACYVRLCSAAKLPNACTNNFGAAHHAANIKTGLRRQELWQILWEHVICNAIIAIPSSRQHLSAQQLGATVLQTACLIYLWLCKQQFLRLIVCQTAQLLSQQKCAPQSCYPVLAAGLQHVTPSAQDDNMFAFNASCLADITVCAEH